MSGAPFIPDRCDAFAEEMLQRIGDALPALTVKQLSVLRSTFALAYVQGRQDGIEQADIMMKRAFEKAGV